MSFGEKIFMILLFVVIGFVQLLQTYDHAALRRRVDKLEQVAAEK